jgi:hypothetical protein
VVSLTLCSFFSIASIRFSARVRRKATSSSARHSSESWNPVFAVGFFTRVRSHFRARPARGSLFLQQRRKSNQKDAAPDAALAR